MDKCEGIGTISIVIHSVWSLGGTVFFPVAMHVRSIDTYEYLYLSAFHCGGGVLKGPAKAQSTLLFKRGRTRYNYILGTLA